MDLQEEKRVSELTGNESCDVALLATVQSELEEMLKKINELGKEKYILKTIAQLKNILRYAELEVYEKCGLEHEIIEAKHFKIREYKYE